MKVQNKVTCVVCGKPLAKSVGTAVKIEDACICANCFTKDYTSLISSNTLDNYSHKPAPNFLGITKSFEKEPSVFYGVELEYERSRTTPLLDIAMLRKKFTRLYFKHDGTIQSDDGVEGVEVVCHPFSISKLSENYGGNIEKTFSIFKSLFYKPSKKCGMHVHISKDKLTQSQILGLFLFFSTNKDFIRKLSGREDIALMDRFAKIVHMPELKELIATEQWKYYITRGDHYNSINITSHTVEIRIWQSTLDAKVFTSRIWFLETLLDFISNTNHRKRTVKDYVDYVRAYKKYAIKNLEPVLTIAREFI